MMFVVTILWHVRVWHDARWHATPYTWDRQDSRSANQVEEFLVHYKTTFRSVAQRIQVTCGRYVGHALFEVRI